MRTKLVRRTPADCLEPQPFPSTPATPGPPSSSTRTDTPSQYRSALFDGPTIFANQQDFFDACAANLQQQFGFEAIPSKQKPTQISTRCPKHKTDGCPFRVCAALCDSGRWAVALRSCVWTHSHPPTKTSHIAKAAVEEAKAEVAPTAPHPSASTSTSSFDQPTNVYDLIPDFPKLSDTWPSVKDAFQTFVLATVPVYGVSMHYHQTSDQVFASAATATSTCSLQGLAGSARSPSSSTGKLPTVAG